MRLFCTAAAFFAAAALSPVGAAAEKPDVGLPECQELISRRAGPDVVIPATGCTSSAPIHIPPGVRVSGSPESTVWLENAASFVLGAGSGLSGLTLMGGSPAVQAQSVSDINLSGLRFRGGGPQITFNGVRRFTIANTRHEMTRTSDTFIFLYNVDSGEVINARIDGAGSALPVSGAGGSRAISVVASRNVAVINPYVANLDATVVSDYAGVAFSEASTDSTVKDGRFRRLLNADAVVVESGSQRIKIDGISATDLFLVPGKGDFANTGDAIDIFNAADVDVANSRGVNIGSRHPGLEVFTSARVKAIGCVFSQTGYHGIVVAGSPSVSLTDVRANDNAFSGLDVSARIGEARVTGTHVTATTENFSPLWPPGTDVLLDGRSVKLVSADTQRTMTIDMDFVGQRSVRYQIDSQVEIKNGEYLRNGTGRRGGEFQAGISVVNGSSISMVGVRASPGQTQRVSLYLANQAKATAAGGELQAP